MRLWFSSQEALAARWVTKACSRRLLQAYLSITHLVEMQHCLRATCVVVYSVMCPLRPPCTHEQPRLREPAFWGCYYTGVTVPLTLTNPNPSFCLGSMSLWLRYLKYLQHRNWTMRVFICSECIITVGDKVMLTDGEHGQWAGFLSQVGACRRYLGLQWVSERGRALQHTEKTAMVITTLKVLQMPIECS